MIHYHGTPISGSEDQVARFLVGRHALVSFLYQQHLPLVTEFCSSFILDSGAFTAWQKGREMDFPGYIKWVRSFARHPGFDWALMPDVIDGDEEQNDALLREWPEDIPGVPVWHMHESFARLERLCANYRTVALGSSGDFRTPNSKTWWGRIRLALDAICDDHGRPPCRLHGLRMLSPAIFTKIPFASADSANVGINTGSLGRFGWYKPPSAYVRAEVLADRIETYNSPPTWDYL